MGVAKKESKKAKAPKQPAKGSPKHSVMTYTAAAAACAMCAALYAGAGQLWPPSASSLTPGQVSHVNCAAKEYKPKFPSCSPDQCGR